MTPSLRAAHAAPGDLDPTFGSGGKVAIDFGVDANAQALILQPNGKLVAAGYSWNGGSDDFSLARYNPDGSLDMTFGASGRVTTDFGGWDHATALVLQPDGKLVAAGFTDNNFALARYNADGTLDISFGSGGRVTTNFGGSSDNEFALVLQPDGKLVAAGNACFTIGPYGRCDFALARYEGTPILTPARQLLNIATFAGPTVPPTPQQQQQTFRTTDPILAGATYYDPNEACIGVPPAGVKLFVFTLEGQLILGKNRDAGSPPTNTVTNTQIGTSKYQALLATLDPGALAPGAYNLVFWVKDCTNTFVLVSEFYAIRVLTP